ncbi:MAG TPA: iron ABC transporter permease [Ruminococcaceae bacterium]|nr:iron ABC transporter permease [Oscillospiraceae bacterium]
MENKKKFYFDVKWLFIIAIVGFLLVFQVFPLVYLLIRAFFAEGSFSLDAFTRIYSTSMNWSCVLNTLITASLSMVFGVLIAFPLAFLVGRTNLYGRKLFRTLFLMTYMVPPYVGAMAWLRLLNPKVGTLNVFLESIFGLSEAPFDIYSIGGLVWVLTTFYYPYAFITLSRAMENMDPSLEEASRISGASPVKMLFTVTLPLMLPSIASSALLVFVAAASCYGIPSIIGAPAKIYTITTRIVDYVYVGSAEGLTDATVLAVFLMVLALVILFISNFVIGKRDYITISGKSVRPNTVDLGKWRIPLTILTGLFAVVVIVIPFASVFATSFTVNMGKSVFEEGNFTIKYWETIFSRNSIVKSAGNSLISSVWAASLGMIVCIIMAYLLKRTNVRGRSIPDFLITVGSGTPSVVIALSLIMTMSGRFGINIYNTIWIMVIAYMIKYMLMGMRSVVSALSRVSPSLEEAAQVSGAGWLRRLKDVVFPLIGPSVVAGWFLIFMPCFYELTMSNMLYSDKTKSLGVDLFLYQTYHSQQTAAALAGAILILVAVLNIVLSKLTKGKFSI